MAYQPITLAADIGGSHVTVALTMPGEVIDHIVIKANPEIGIRPYLTPIEEAAQTLVRRHSLLFSDLSGFGLALPMLVDPVSCRVLSTAANKYCDAKEVCFERWSKEKFGLKIKIEVDGNAGCLGEWFYGAGKNLQDMVYVILGTGIGCSVIFRGQVLRGRNFTAGALGGHMVVNVGGNNCVCPGNGCVEAETGTWALPYLAAQIPEYKNSLLAQREVLNYEVLFHDMDQGDEVATRLVNRSIDYWGAMLVNLALCYTPEKIIMAGGILKAYDRMMPRLNTYMKQQLWTLGKHPEICVADHPETGALLGIHAMINKPIKYL